MADSALTQMWSGGSHQGGSGSSLGAAVAAPVTAAASLGNAASHATLLGLIALLVTLWALVHIANFRFVISTGIGR